MVQWEGGSSCLGEEVLCKPDWVEHHISRPINRADGLMSRLPGGRGENTVLNDWRIESER